MVQLNSSAVFFFEDVLYKDIRIYVREVIYRPKCCMNATPRQRSKVRFKRRA